MTALRAKYDQQIEALMTEEQKEKYKEIQAQRGQRRPSGGSPGGRRPGGSSDGRRPGGSSDGRRPSGGFSRGKSKGDRKD